MAQVKHAAEEFISSLQKSEVTLDQVARKLEEEFAQRCKPGEVNPLQLAQRIRRLASEIPLLQQSCQGMIKAKQDLVDGARQQLLANFVRLRQLRSAAGLGPDPAGEQAHHGFQAALAEWDQQLQSHGPVERAGAGVGQMSRDDLNRALAGVALSRA